MNAESQSAGVQMLFGFVSGPPVWVWPLLVLLLFVGFRASRPRQTSIVLYFILPFMGVMSLESVAGLAQPVPAWAAFFVSYISATLVFYRRQGHWLLQKSGRTLNLAGEWATMTAVMVVFWSNFIKGTFQAIIPDVTTQIWFCVGFAAIVGFASGSFLGRFLHIVMAPQSQKQPVV